MGNLQKINTNGKLVHKYIITYYSNKENQTLLFSSELTHKDIKLLAWWWGSTLTGGWQSLRSQKCPKQGALQEKNPNTSYESRME